jgi:hypothetical protein
VAEAIKAMTDEGLTVTGDRPLFARDGAVHLQPHLR